MQIKSKYESIHFNTSLNIGGAEGALYNYLKHIKSKHLVVCLLDIGYYGKKLNQESDHDVINFIKKKSKFKKFFIIFFSNL